MPYPIAINGVLLPLFSIVSGGFTLIGFTFQITMIIASIYIAAGLYHRFMWAWIILILLIFVSMAIAFLDLRILALVVLGIFFAFNIIYISSRNNELKHIQDFKLKFWEL